MHFLRYRITNIAPLVITSRQGDLNMVATEKYIPGTSVLGMFADRYIRQKPGLTADQAYTNDQFQAWFLSGKLTIGPAYLVSQDWNGQEQVYLPVPLSIRKQKHAEQVYDFLHKGDDPSIRTTAIDKFCVLDANTLQTQEVMTSLNFHHARDPETGTTAGENIFTYESIDCGHTFEGLIFGEHDDLQALLTHCGSVWEASLGRSKNAQYGEVQVTFLNANPQPVQLPKRLPDQPGKDHTIALSLLSDTIIYNEHGFPSTDSQDLKAHLDTLLETPVTIKRARAKQSDVETFMGIWRLKTPSAACLRAGSSFLLTLNDYDPNKLAKIEARGIGERTHEGFGRCRFGWQTEPTLTIPSPKAQAQRLPKPDGVPPAITRDILQNLVSDALKKEAELLALTHLKGFLKDLRKLPSNSLLGRLEAFVRHSSGQQEFVMFLGALRKTAKDQLEHCHNNQKTLLQFFLTQNITIPAILEESSRGCRELNEEFSLGIEQDGKLETQLYQRYFITFLAMMRKRAKEEE